MKLDPGVLALLGLILCAFLLLLRRPLAGLLRLALRSSLWMGGLALFGTVSPLIGVSLGVNLFNGVLLGLLGLPGFGLLLMLHWVLQ